MELKPGYKQTELGVIPEEWEVCKLGDIVIYTNGKAHESIISDFGKYVVVNSKFISTEGDVQKYSDECFCPTIPEDILMVMSDVPNGRAIAKCFLVDCENRFTVNQRICILRAGSVDSKFLFFKINRHPFYLGFDDGVKQTNLRKEDVLACPIAVPKSLSEQRAIATALSDVDALIASLDKLIAKKRDIKQAAMQELLTGKRRLPGFDIVGAYGNTPNSCGACTTVKPGECHSPLPDVPHGWEVKRLGEICPLQRGFDLPTSQLRPGSFPVVYSNGVMNYHAYSMVKGPGVITGRSGTIGNVHYVENDFWPHNTSLWVTSFKGNSPKFIYYLLTYLGLDQFGTGSGVPTLNRNDVHAYKVPIPPTIDEQTAIATILSDMDTEIAALEQKRDKTRLLKQGMMQELLTGRIRLV